MSNKSMRLITVVAGLLLSACVVADASAQCCGQAATSYYAPAYTSYYAPAAYQNVLQRLVSRLLVGPRGSADLGFAVDVRRFVSVELLRRVSPRVLRSVRRLRNQLRAGLLELQFLFELHRGLRSVQHVQHVHDFVCPGLRHVPIRLLDLFQHSGRDTGIVRLSTAGRLLDLRGERPAAAPPTYVQPPAAAPQPTPAPASTEPPPSLNSSGPQPNTSNLPVDSTPPANVQPAPGSDTEGVDPYKVNKGDSATYFEAPKLFNPKDRTAKHTGIAPVRTAVYEQPVMYRKTSTTSRGPVTAAQAQQDAIGWSSASK